jgi:subtilisin family serine protease
VTAPRAFADEPRRAWVEPRLARALEDPVAADTELRLQDSLRRRGTPADELRVIVEPPAGQGADALPLAQLRALGARIDGRSRSLVRISANAAVLRRAAELGGIRALRFPLRPIPVDGAGSHLSESVALTGASALQAAGIDGSGVSVAVVDLGFMRLGEAKTSGDIPASAIAVDLSGMGIETTTAHGTAVAEEVADMAPGVQLYVIKFADEVDFENAVTYVRDHGIRIANLSVNWFGTSYYDDSGPISDIINRSHDQDGVFWTVGGGNWGYRHWRGGWLDEDADGWLSFSPNDERLDLVAELNQICILLNWNQYPDHYTGPLTDLDLFVYSAASVQVASSQNRQTPGSFPVEQACFTRVASEEPYSLGVHRFSGPTTGLDLTIVSSDAAVSMADRVTSSSTVDPAVAHGAFAVGAIDQAVWLLPAPGIEALSSRGPTTDGRPKPELVAPDRTMTLAYGVSTGTSFAAPVVAGAAALLAEQSPGISANQIRAALVGAAHDVGPVGRDNDFGYGQLVAQALALPVDSDGDGVPDASDACPFAADNHCLCGDVDGNGSVSSLDELVIRVFLSDPSGPNTGMVRPELCNVFNAAAPFPLDCRIDDWVVMRRGRAGRAPGIQPVCSPALPP